MIDSSGSFHLQAKDDCIIASSLPLCEVFGEFLTGAEIPPREAVKDVQLMPVCVTNLDILATFSHPQSWEKSFQKTPATLGAFLNWLQSEKNIVKVELVCHKLDAAAGTCEQVERCMFERKKLPARSKASAENIGSFLVILNEIEAYNYAILCSDVDRMLSQVRLPHALPHWECNFQRCGVWKIVGWMKFQPGPR